MINSMINIKSLSIFFVILWFGQSYGQVSSKINGYVIKFEKINFKMDDSVKKVTLFINPNGFFEFREGFVESAHPGMFAYYPIDEKQKKFEKDTFVLKSHDITDINNLFPLLYKNENSILNHYPHDFKPIDYFYNLQYSYILTNFKDKELYGKHDDKIIRIIEPDQTSGIFNGYNVMTLDLNSQKFYFKQGKFEQYGFKLVKDDSLSLSNKQFRKIKDLIEHIDFKSVKYFTEVGINLSTKCLIEYNNLDNYCVFEKQILSHNKEDEKFNQLLIMFWSLKGRMKK